MSFDLLHFQQPFRKYQTLILDLVEKKQAQGERQFHLVAPPGAGKTIVGLELVRRFGQPAVVFAPTSTIQAQWQAKVDLFLADPRQRDQIVSNDPANLHSINIFTYQLLTISGGQVEGLRQKAEADWIASLVKEGKSDDEAMAHARLLRLKENNPDAYDAEIRKRYRRHKREALRDPEFDSTQVLHPNSRALIDRLVSFGIRTIVLDECHHLLDYWALVLKELLRRIPDAYIIGLTATLPDLEAEDEHDNYTSLLGEVDFEVPTPAVVKEGSLAPYRDLVMFCEPTQREADYLNDVQAAFERALKAITESDRFAQWVAATLLYQTPELWLSFVKARPAVAVAGIKYLKSRQQPIPKELPLQPEMSGPLTLDDWAALLEPYGLEVLKVSSDTEDHQRLSDLEKALAPFGLSLTERGLRQGRAPGDLVLALSEAKDATAVKILQAEHLALGSQLRAVVITDFETLSSQARRLKDVLDPDAGSAVRLFRAIVTDPELNQLDAVLVTGRTVLLDSDHGEELLTTMRKWLADRHLTATIDFTATDDDRIMALSGSGADWSSRTYVQMLTAMFEQGFTRCLVGTRGIFGEGWDALVLNTLVDLTAVTTSTGVNQLRGRTLRLDPAWPRKVAHNWDVVCLARNFERGNSDLARFERKHAQYWGVMPLIDPPVDPSSQSLVAVPVSPGQIAQGVVHVDRDLAFDLATRDFREINFDKFGRRLLTKATAAARIASYDLWAIGASYDNVTYTACQLDTSELKFVTANTTEMTLGQAARDFRPALVAGAGWLILFGIRASVSIPGLAFPLLLWAVVFGLMLIPLALLILNGRTALQRLQKLLMGLPAAPILKDFGLALIAALRESGLVSQALPDRALTVHLLGNTHYEVFLDQASPEDSDLFAQAYQQLFGALTEPRYMVTRDMALLPDNKWQLIWNLIRPFVKTAQAEMVYYPVPDCLASNKQKAEIFAEYWRRFVGGGALIYTKTEAGQGLLAQARNQPRPKVKQMAIELWR